jgi:hypothetical protein
MKKTHLEIPTNAVKSGAIAEIGHHPETNTLRIKFASGHVGDYAGFPAEKFAQFQTAESLGKFFHAHIRAHHEHTRIF